MAADLTSPEEQARITENVDGLVAHWAKDWGPIVAAAALRMQCNAQKQKSCID